MPVVGRRSRGHRNAGGLAVEEHARDARELPRQGDVSEHSLSRTRGTVELV